jgi:hypothetical protein
MSHVFHGGMAKKPAVATRTGADLHPRTWVSAGAALVACSLAISWMVAGTWVIVTTAGLICVVGVSVWLREGRRHPSDEYRSTTPHAAKSPPIPVSASWCDRIRVLR